MVCKDSEGDGNEEFDDDDGDEELVELRLVPPDVSQCKESVILPPLCYMHTVESIYSAISECQLLYPDPEDSDSEEEGGEMEEEEGMVEEESGLSGVYLSEGASDGALHW